MDNHTGFAECRLTWWPNWISLQPDLQYILSGIGIGKQTRGNEVFFTNVTNFITNKLAATRFFTNVTNFKRTVLCLYKVQTAQ